MTINSTNTKDVYSGNGATTVFGYNYKIFANTQILVTKTDVDGIELVLVLNVDYSVSGVGADNGNITYPISGSPLAVGELITLSRNVPITQETDLVNQGAWNPDVVENALDKSRMIDLQQQDELDRSLKTSISETTKIGNMGTVVQRAQTLLSFDDLGNPVTFEGSGANGKLVTVDDVLAVADFVDAAEAFAILSAASAVDSQNSADASQVSADDAQASADAAAVTSRATLIDAATFGAADNIGAVGVGSLSMTSTGRSSVAMIDQGSGLLRTKDFDFQAQTWSDGSASLALNATDRISITAVGIGNIAHWDNVTNQIRLYVESGVTFNLAFGGFNFSPAGRVDMTSLDGVTIVVIDEVDETLQAYDNNGSFWSTLGNQLDLSSICPDPEHVEAMSATRVVVAGGKLAILDFDGNDWSLTGNSTPAGENRQALTVMNETDFLYHRLDVNRIITVFRFDGTDIEEISDPLIIPATFDVDIASLNGTDFAFMDVTVKDLQLYAYRFYTGAGPFKTYL